MAFLLDRQAAAHHANAATATLANGLVLGNFLVNSGLAVLRFLGSAATGKPTNMLNAFALFVGVFLVGVGQPDLLSTLPPALNARREIGRIPVLASAFSFSSGVQVELSTFPPELSIMLWAFLFFAARSALKSMLRSSEVIRRPGR
ncbi:MAG: hypothetical protein DWI31_02215, partial [Candidatus Aquidulcis sp.]